MGYVLLVVGGLVGLMVTLQLTVRLRARLLHNKPLPELPGSWGRELARNHGALLYFFSPGCAACRPLTPRFKEMSARRPSSVYAVNVAEELALARALHVMATPSVVEVADGTIVGYHVGQPPAALIERYT